MTPQTARKPRLWPGRVGDAGFTLIEMAVVLAIVGVLMVSLLLPLGTQIEQRQITDTRARLEDAREALIGFAIIHGRLPCPATTASAGLELPAGGGSCTKAYDGFLPARTLSFNPQSADGYAIDAWNNPIRYAVSKGKTGTTTYAFTTVSGSEGIKYRVQTNGFADTGLQPDLRVCSDAAPSIPNAGTATAACPAGKDITDATSVVAVIYSVGKNFASGGAAGIDEAANWTPDPADATKLTTLSRDRVFVSHTPTPTGAKSGATVIGEFDDIVLWIPAATLFSRMITAGALP